MAPDNRLYNALVEILAGNEPDLAISAVWALGRMGDRRAIEPLREALGSRYALIQARSARALATLSDYDIIPLLVERFKTEPDDGLRIAYASALGSLHYKEAVPLLLPFLYDMRGKDSRMELALALARIARHADQFVILAREVRAFSSAPLGRAVGTLRRLKLASAMEGTFSACCDGCVEAFERGDLERAARCLADVLDSLCYDEFQPVHAAILRECSRRLREFGAARPEYTLLAIHSATVALAEG